MLGPLARRKCHGWPRLNISRSVVDFIAAYRSLRNVPDLICLDHDLFTDSPDDSDPGDGRDAANFLITQIAIAPVLIHSSNSIAADSMLYSMRDAGWTVTRIAPIGDDWIEADWYPVASELAMYPNKPIQE
ncbi:cyclic-phosphate processing receiver domain-containing protein [Schlesneria paludicola]|uniref:cyclic-phosphate processing receiver domain-containing protein n=1 Tax=Schlesneria paludicola TaxID=360056 RepID=UPI0004927C46